MIDALQQFLSEVDAYIERSGMSPTGFGLAAMNDGKFLPRVREAGSLTVRSMNRARQYMHDNPPPSEHTEQRDRRAAAAS
jgi:hypothetical protein